MGTYNANFKQSEVEVLLGNGDETFQSTTPIGLDNFELSSLAAGEFNGDGRTDLAVAGSDSASGQGEVEALLGNGDGTFQTTRPIDLDGLNPAALVTGDFNGDGRTDLAVVGSDSSGQGELEVLFGNGDGTFQTTMPIVLTDLVRATSLVTGDFKANGRTDLAVAGLDASDQGEVEVLLSNSDGPFQTATPTGLGGLEPISLLAGDFDGNGRDALAVLGFVTSSQQVDLEVLSGHGDGTFQATTPIAFPGFHPQFLVSGNFNGDGDDDLAVGGIRQFRR